MPPPTANFNVGGTVFEVAVSTIESQPEGLLAKMIDGRFPCGKDESGAYFIDRSPRFFDIVLDVHRDSKVYPLSPGFPRERVVAELEYYGLQDFFEGGAPVDLTVESTVRNILDAHQSIMHAKQSLQDASGEFLKWQEAQKELGNALLAEGFARRCIASAQICKEKSPGTLVIPPLQVGSLPNMQGGWVYPYRDPEVSLQIVKLFEELNTKATVTGNTRQWSSWSQPNPPLLAQTPRSASVTIPSPRTPRAPYRKPSIFDVRGCRARSSWTWVCVECRRVTAG